VRRREQCQVGVSDGFDNFEGSAGDYCCCCCCIES
jgi:hypothetical protein